MKSASVVGIFAAGAVDGFDVMRYAQQSLLIGSIPVKERVFRNPGQVHVWSRSYALVDGIIEGSLISRLCDTYKLDLRIALAPIPVDQYTYEIEFYILNEYSGITAGTQRSINVGDYTQVDF